MGELLGGRVLFHNEEVAHLLVDLGELLDEFAALLLCKLQDLGGDLVRLYDLVAFLALVVDGLPTYEVDDTTEFVLDTDGNLDRSSANPQLLANLVDDTPGVCAGPAS